MRALPVTYRIPRSMVAYTIFGSVVILLLADLAVLFTGPPGQLESAIMLAAVLAVAVIDLRVVRLGTVVRADGITRRGFLRDRHYHWSDIGGLHLHDNQVAHRAYGFQVTSRYVVSLRDHRRGRRRTLIFLDERAFPTARAFEAELDDILARWQRERVRPPAR